MASIASTTCRLGTFFVQQSAVAGANAPDVATVEVVDDDGVQVQSIDNYIGTVNSVSAGPPNSDTEMRFVRWSRRKPLATIVTLSFPLIQRIRKMARFKHCLMAPANYC